MSFTVMRHKDGIPAPIKLSIWDAFKGVPPPRPPKLKSTSSPQPTPEEKLPSQICQGTQTEGVKILQECPCCHRITDEQPSEAGKKGKKTGATPATSTQGGKKPEDTEQKGREDTVAKDPKDETQSDTHSARPQESYTEEETQKIIELKKAGSTWKEILAAIEKVSMSQLKSHWKTINQATLDKPSDTPKQESDKVPPAPKDGEKPAASSVDRTDEKKNKSTNSQVKEKPKQDAQPKASETEPKAANSKTPAKKTKVNFKPVNGVLKSWSDRYDRQKWMAAASRHYDRTGQRITPATAKKLAEGK